MKSVLLIGLGRFGWNVAVKLHELNHEVMAVDKDEERVDAALPYTTGAQIGDSTNENFMRSLGVGNFDLCIVTIAKDFQASLETTSLLKELGARKVIARAARDVQAKFLLRNGADSIVYPEKQLGAWTAIRYSSEHIFDYIELSDDYAIFEIEVPQAWIGKTVGGINIRRKFDITIMARRVGDKLEMRITPETCFEEGDKLLVLGKYRDIQRCFRI